MNPIVTQYPLSLMKQVTRDMIEYITASILLKSGIFLEEEQFYFSNSPKLYIYLALSTSKNNSNHKQIYNRNS